MGGITIIDAKIVGVCSYCRKKGDEILKNKHGRVYGDGDLACVCCGIGCSHKTGNIKEKKT